MKGFIFSEFLELVEESYGYSFADEMITNTSSEGVYTSISTYPVEELVEMVVYVSEKNNVPVPDLLVTFGHFLFPRFVKSFPAFFSEGQSMIDFLHDLHDIIHVEVRKLYPGAKTPVIGMKEQDGGFVLYYESPRKLAWFAKGMLEASQEHFNERFTIEMEMLNEEGSRVNFHLHKD